MNGLFGVCVCKKNEFKSVSTIENLYKMNTIEYHILDSFRLLFVFRLQLNPNIVSSTVSMCLNALLL